MEHQKILNSMKQAILDSRQGEGTLSMINQMETMMQEVKLSVTQKY